MYKIFVKILTERNVIIRNKFNFSDLSEVLSTLGRQHRGSFTLLATQCNLHFDKPQQNDIHFLKEDWVIFLKTLYTICAKLHDNRVHPD